MQRVPRVSADIDGDKRARSNLYTTGGGRPEATAINNMELSSFLRALVDYLD